MRDTASRPTNFLQRINDPYPFGESRLYRLVAPVQLDPAAGPIILKSPQSLLVSPGEPATFKVHAIGSGTLSYQWLFNSSPIPGTITSSLIIHQARVEDMGSYGVLVTDSSGQASNQPEALLGVRPRILVHPQSQSVPPGTAITLSVEATGLPPLRYLWTRNGKTLPGETNAMLQLTAVLEADAGIYQVNVSHPTPLGQAGTWSQSAVLVVPTEGN